MKARETDLERIMLELENGVCLKIYVTPRAGETRLIYRDGELLFYSEKNPKHHAVNRDLIKYLYRIFDRAENISIIRGRSDRTKIVKLIGLSKDEAIEKLLKFIEK